ncbi:LamG-like jellyroll fold domain-containing protein [Botrimarina sp.]|uniref:LamG-like jellyroll fold domain-containing protein n=1 Tax=Botrimarina sp. TaxID=2795802 RepID=UPI0032EEDCA2
MLLTSQRAFAIGVVAIAASTHSAIAQMTVLAVDLSGDVSMNRQNSSLDEGGEVQTSTGDFDGDGMTDDARFLIPIDHAGNFVDVPTNGLDGPNKSGTWASGVEVLSFDTTTATGLQLYRYEDGLDRLQAGNAANGAAAQSFAFAPHVRKNNFLNGASVGETVSFTDDPNGFTIDWNFQNSVNPPTRRVRATVQNGEDWYVTGWASASKDDARTFNPATEIWFPYDTATSLFVEEVGGGDLNPVGSGGVLGSTFTDIQALGGLLYETDYSGPSNNAVVQNLDALTVSLDFTHPPLPTAPIGEAIVYWQMDSTDAGARLVDPFSEGGANEFFWNGTAVPDASGGFSDPLFLGDPIQPPTMPDAFFDTANAPELTTGNQGVFGEALRFNRSEEDEAIGIVAWKGDDIDPFVTEDLDSVYVDFHFKEDDNMNGTQVLVRGRSVFEIRINNNGQLEWLTRNTDNTVDLITSDPLGAEGDWRHVKAWHDADGNKALYLDGELVGVSAPGPLKNDTNSITIGNKENDVQWFSGLIDEVFVGTGVPDAIAGDYNSDGVVDAADYTVWRDSVGKEGSFLAADGNGDAVVDTLDYDVWVANFGATAAPPTNAVPEPGTLVMLALACVGLRRRVG